MFQVFGNMFRAEKTCFKAKETCFSLEKHVFSTSNSPEISDPQARITVGAKTRNMTLFMVFNYQFPWNFHFYSAFRKL